MKSAHIVLFLSLVAACLLTSARLADASQKHDRAFWLQIVKADAAVPAGTSADALSDELSDMLGNVDPVLRDDIAYTLLAQWLAVTPKISDEQARRLVDRWTANLRAGTASRADGAILLRSFSALSLAAAAARENAKPFMGDDRYRAVLAAAIAYFESERDPRGFDPKLGWVHATAHTADLLKFLARNPRLGTADQATLLQAIVRKTGATTVAWVSGEDERIGRVILSLVGRPDLDWSAYEAAVKDLARLATFPDPPNPETLARYGNARHLLTALCAVLSTAPETAVTSRARKVVVDALR